MTRTSGTRVMCLQLEDLGSLGKKSKGSQSHKIKEDKLVRHGDKYGFAAAERECASYIILQRDAKAKDYIYIYHDHQLNPRQVQHHLQQVFYYLSSTPHSLCYLINHLLIRSLLFVEQTLPLHRRRVCGHLRLLSHTPIPHHVVHRAT